MTAPLPLEGFRVLDFCVAWAGPFATQLLADLGAEVIKVESTQVFQMATRGYSARPTKDDLAGLAPIWGAYPDGEPGARPWNRSPMGINTFRNKRSMTCNLRTSEGRETLRRLVEISDVVYENNPTDTMEKLGVTDEWLRSIRPDIIFVRAPAFAGTGKRKYVRGVGSTVEAAIGHTLLRGYANLEPLHTPVIYPSDAFAGINGAFAVVAALNARRRTGRGQLIELPQAECGLTMLPEAALAYALNGRVSGTIGNRDVHGAAPFGVYPCAGDDRWLAITVSTDAEWPALCTLMDRPDLAVDERLQTAAGRLAAHDELDAAIAEWTRPREAHELFALLQEHRIAAGPVMDARDAHADPHLAARGFFETVEHSDTGTHEWPGVPWKFSHTPLSIRLPSRNLGEDNEYVYKELLGYSDAEYDNLVAIGEAGTEPDPSIP